MDFLIIGAMKSATSTLWALVRDHPDVYMPMPKELPFFSGQDYELGWAEFERRNLRDVPAGAVVGKATPAYMAGIPNDRAWDGEGPAERAIPERIARQFPDVKLIAILRDPVERALSHFSMARNLGLESREAEEAFEELLQPAVLEAARREPHKLQGYVVLGEYARILRGYLEVFDSSQLLTLSTAELGDDPLPVLNRVWPFLGVEAHLPADLNTRYMVSTGLSPRLRFLVGGGQDRLGVRAIRKTLRALPPAISGPLRRLAWGVVARSVASSGGDGEPRPEPGEQLSPQLYARLIAHYSEDSAELEELFGWSPLISREP